MHVEAIIGNISTPHKPYALRASDEIINQSANKVCKNNDKYPDDLIIALRGLFCSTINQHPNPEERAQDTNDEEE